MRLGAIAGLRTWGILALCFIVMFATSASAVHVVELTAWDLFLGLALLCTAAGTALPGSMQP